MLYIHALFDNFLWLLDRQRTKETAQYSAHILQFLLFEYTDFRSEQPLLYVIYKECFPHILKSLYMLVVTCECNKY